MVACALGACSLSISAPAADRRRNQVPDCDTGKGLVAIDGLAAVGFGVGGLAALSEDQGTGAIALVGAALFTAAALHGSNNADKCKQAIADYGKEMATLAPDLTQAVEVRRTPKKRKPDPTIVPQAEPPDEIDATDPDPTPATPATPADPTPEPAKPEPKKPDLKPEHKPEPRRPNDWGQFWREVP